MRQKPSFLVIVLVIISVSMAWESGLFADPPTAADIQKGTETVGKFLECIEAKIKGTTTAFDISQTVACLPGSCTVTATMSEDSAQAACFSGGPEKCQLPRVILKCPGPPLVEFSYLLCGTGSVAGGSEIGSNRIEMSVAVGTLGTETVMVMADIPVPLGATTVGTTTDVLSVVPDSKKCNECHKDGNPDAVAGTPQLSKRIEVFGKTRTSERFVPRKPSFIIFTDDCEVANKVKGIDLNGGLTKVNKFSEICDCIDMAIKNGNFVTMKNARGDVIGEATAAQAAIVSKLCRELEKYQHHTPWPTCTPSPSPSPSPTGTPPTVITLVSFNAKADNSGRVALTWETVAEVDNAGFNLYRARVKDGRYKKINTAPIPAQGDATSGATYRYVDKPRNGTYYYKLEDVDYYGVSTMHDPEKVRVRSNSNASHRSKKARR